MKTKPIKAKNVSTDAQLITSTHSLNVVKTLIHTAIGVITYLRCVTLLETFGSSSLHPVHRDDKSFISGESFLKNASTTIGKFMVNHVFIGLVPIAPKVPPIIMTGIFPMVRRPEERVADILESSTLTEVLRKKATKSWITLWVPTEEGAMDAIQRGYLRQLLFAMYLDPNKPRDVIECYTFIPFSPSARFNITYSKSKDREGELIPELEVRDQLREMSLGGKISVFNEADPQQSRTTCGMVKRQVQALIKNLICSTQSLSDIHGRRFLTFKLHYNEFGSSANCLDWFENQVRHRRIMSRLILRQAMQNSIASHSVPRELKKFQVLRRWEKLIPDSTRDVRVALATISGYLPEPSPSDSILLPKGKSPLELREIELKKIRQEAKARQIVWDTEKFLAPSPPATPNDFNKEDTQSITLAEPIGRRDSNDRIIPFPRQDDDPNLNEPGAVRILKRKATPESKVLPESDNMLNSTQTEVQSQQTPVSVRRETCTESLAWSLKSTGCRNDLSNGVSTSAQETHGKQAEEFKNELTRIRKNNQSQVFQEKARLDGKPIPNHSANTMDDDPIDEGSIPNHNLNSTRLVANVEALSDSIDPIESFTSSNMVDVGSVILPRPVATVEPERKEITTLEPRMDDHAPQKADSNKKIKTAKVIWPPSANKSDICECRDANDDQDMINCEICKRWRHLNCYGYKSEKDPRIPDFFVCYRCRIHKGMDLEQVWKREDDISVALEGLRGLCIFRRTLQIIYQEGLPAVLKDLAHRLGNYSEVDLSTVSQIKHRLETEKFICPKSNSRTKSSGILESERKGSSKAIKSKRYIKHMIVNESYEQKKLRDKLYFTPGTGAEAKLLEKFGNDSITEDNQDQQVYLFII
ncbi:hypothetical protein VP01_941g12 [Puccinia sorghi]|uniref:Zinc finger PHD-type domain-containing protein n=1 Tax=Puccinia sorghi TaxID=27349 RepID=A0A0L6U756_9BASI|nr:hypothetical protein VP01_941g12 [Puccinia sorghi]